MQRNVGTYILYTQMYNELLYLGGMYTTFYVYNVVYIYLNIGTRFYDIQLTVKCFIGL